MQRAHDLTCKTKIDYIHKGEIKSSEGDGENDIADANSVLQIIRAHPQTHWIVSADAEQTVADIMRDFKKFIGKRILTKLD